MLQSIATRTIVPVGLAVTGFVAICCLSLYSIMKQDMIDDAAQGGRNIANTVVLSTRYAMLHNDRQHLGSIIANIGQHQGVEHLRVFNHDGFITFSRNQTEIGQQVNKKVEGCSGCHSGEKPAEQLAAVITNLNAGEINELVENCPDLISYVQAEIESHSGVVSRILQKESMEESRKKSKLTETGEQS